MTRRDNAEPPTARALIAVTAGIAVLYVATGRFGLWLGGLVDGDVSLIWPPTGVALAAVFLFGLRAWPGLALGAFVTSNWSDLAALVATGQWPGASILFGCITALGNPLPAILTLTLARRLRGQRRLALGTVGDGLFLVSVGGIITPLVSALTGTVGLWALSRIPAEAFEAVFWSWYVGDAVGATVVGTMLIALLDGRRAWRIRAPGPETAALVLSVMLLWLVVLRDSLHQSDMLVFAAFPLIIWSAMRFSVGTTATVAAAINGLAVVSLMGGIAARGAADPNLPIQEVQIFMMVMTATGLILGLSIEERRRTERRLRRTLADLGRAHEELAHFAYIASHDLQEPLRSVSSFAELIVRDVEGSQSKALRQYAGYLNEGTQTLKHHFLALMTYAEVDASPPSNQAVDLGQALSRAADTCRAAHPDATLHLIADPLPVVRGTADQFQALFRLLIDNAIRFRAGRPTVTVTVRSAVEPEQVSLTLSDDGPGIPAAFHKSAFKLFRRAREDRHPTGFGLGLAMARRIVTRHGGTITLDPGPGGACFRVTLPLAPVEADLVVRREADP